MDSDFSLEKAALSRGNGNFPFQVNEKNLNIKNPVPPLDIIFYDFYFFSKNSHLILKLSSDKNNGTRIS